MFSWTILYCPATRPICQAVVAAIVAEPEMEPEQEPSGPDQDIEQEVDGLDEIVMVELQHATSGQRFAVTVPCCASMAEVKAALGSTLGLQSATRLHIVNESGAVVDEHEELAGRTESSC
eukprot:s4549_g2.t1